ncbi:protein phosphatase 2C domain-containing protein [Oscillatoria sp. FACHB-1406]|uniref:protein phosphatase 2C domain-containing protein n=1 Tax=Oscillatoria sp. FACHB-1406 TaxID=2692846 RepID=UPI00199BE1C9|nr:protein phosphatase 2C domain-containing protein [Oscillatoria sp. FACHB-1406]MBD2580553.1 protein phosphatase 2C domain-containing protein [Oscillatoria sp. FACHB-1406]
MQDTAIELYCSNPGCQAANPLDGKFCHQCRTPLLKRYLWAVGRSLEHYQPGEWVGGDRYLALGSQLVLDTQPAVPPLLLEDIPPSIFNYLKLFPYRPQVPQVYGQLERGKEDGTPGIWLLESGSISAAVREKFDRGEYFPQLTSAWPQASPLRQLHWLWQMAQLWQPLLNQNVASSLLAPELLRVNGATFRLQELWPDRAEKPTLQQLGELWSQWLPTSAPKIQPFLSKLIEQLRSGQLDRIDVLIARLDRALDECGNEDRRQYQIYALTDTGPSRDHNEDACYPLPQSRIDVQDRDYPLALVCDGIGGHEGGEIASRIAIDLVRDRLALLQNGTKAVSTSALVETIEEAVCEANDAISNRNDLEQRQERQRMGTTLVLALARARQMYLAHVGDSRIYRIDRFGCTQTTLDDDWASWEVRLGYTFYRNAIQHPNAGALLQALGMNSSSRLRPTINRFTLDEDCIFLLCSDGLSDFDRVEQYWESEILPVLNNKQPIERAVENLMEIATRQNGHDNITIALFACQVLAPSPTENDRPIALPPAEDAKALDNDTTQLPTEVIGAGNTERVLPAPSPRSSVLPRLALALAVLLLGTLGLAGLSYWLFPEVRSRANDLLGGTPEPTPTALDTFPSPAPSVAPSVSTPDFGALLEIPQAVRLYPQPTPAVPQTLAPGSQLLVTGKVLDAERQAWLKVRVCKSAPAKPSVLAGTEGWVRPLDGAIAAAKRLDRTVAKNCAPSRPQEPRGSSQSSSILSPTPPASPSSRSSQPSPIPSPTSPPSPSNR